MCDIAPLDSVMVSCFRSEIDGFDMLVMVM